VDSVCRTTILRSLSDMSGFALVCDSIRMRVEGFGAEARALAARVVGFRRQHHVAIPGRLGRGEI
jgi:hypothetical protein